MNWLVTTIAAVAAALGSPSPPLAELPTSTSAVSPVQPASDSAERGATMPSGHGSRLLYPVGPPAGPTVVHRFDPPGQPWLPGHRGVDLAADRGTEVRSAAAGEVSFADAIAGRGVVVVDHGRVRSTYEPVEPMVAAGDTVAAGEPIGRLTGNGSHCAPMTCLHWGVRSGDTYIDPLTLARSGGFRLLPLDERAVSGAAPVAPNPPDSPAPAGATTLGWPVAAPRVTSAFGMRTHPITGVYRLHDGTDFGAACGITVRAAAAGRVTHARWRGAYGLQVGIEHGDAGQGRMATSYSHLAHAGVSPGQFVQKGQTIGRVGTTGSSTGCHLHFMTTVNGTLTDPMRLLPGLASHALG